MRPDMTPEAYAARGRLIRERHALYLAEQAEAAVDSDLAETLATLEASGKPSILDDEPAEAPEADAGSYDHGTEFVDWRSEVEGDRLPEVE